MYRKLTSTLGLLLAANMSAAAQVSCNLNPGDNGTIVRAFLSETGEQLATLSWTIPAPKAEPGSMLWELRDEANALLPASAFTASWRPQMDGGSAIDLRLRSHELPLEGWKRLRVSWPEGDQMRTLCGDFRINAEPAREVRVEWQVNGNRYARLNPVDTPITAGEPLSLVVTASGLWKDTRLELDPALDRLLDVGEPTFRTGGGRIEGTYPVAFVPGGKVRIPGGRYPLSLTNRGWDTFGQATVRAPSLEVSGERPTFLARRGAAAGEGYQVAAAARAIDVNLVGRNLASPLDVKIEALGPDGRTLGEYALQASAVPCDGEECLTLRVPWHVGAATSYRVSALTFDRQPTQQPALIRVEPAGLVVDSVRSDFPDASVLFAGRDANLTLHLPARERVAPGTRFLVRFEGGDQDWTGTAEQDGRTVHVRSVSVPTIQGGRRDALLIIRRTDQQVYGRAPIAIINEPRVAEPIRLYGGPLNQTIRIEGEYLSNVQVHGVSGVAVSDVTSDATTLRATVRADAAAEGGTSYRLPAYWGDTPVGAVPVEVVPRQPAAQAIAITASDQGGDCVSPGPANSFARARVSVKEGGALCIAVLPSPVQEIHPDVRDQIRITLRQNGRPVGSPIEREYPALSGTPGHVVIPLEGVSGGSPLQVEVRRSDGTAAVTRVRMSVKARVGIFGGISAAPWVPGQKVADGPVEKAWAPRLEGHYGIWTQLDPGNSKWIVFAGRQQLPRSFSCGEQSVSVNAQAWTGGLSLLGIMSLGAGWVPSSQIPATCTATAEGELPRVEDANKLYFFIGTPTAKLPLPRILPAWAGGQ